MIPPITSTPNNPFETTYDVAVFGGGLTGVAASLTLARENQRVLLVEGRCLLGWEVSSAFSCTLRPGSSEAGKIIRRALSAARGLRGEAIDAPTTEVILDQVLENHHVDVLLYSTAMELLVSGRHVTGVVIGNKQGKQTIRAHSWVDATDEGTLWRQTDVPWLDTPERAWRHTLFMSPAADGMAAEIAVGDASEQACDVRVLPSVRLREARVEFTVAKDSKESGRLLMEQVLRTVRRDVPELTDAVLTHASVESLPFGPTKSLSEPMTCHPQYENLLAAGNWADGQQANDPTDLAARIDAGDAVARRLLSSKSTAPEKAADESALQGAQVREVDVVVIGGGTAGGMATVAAARAGAKTICLEAGSILGGMKTGSGQDYVGHGRGGGLQDEFHDRCKEYHPLYAGTGRLPKLHYEIGRTVLEQMAVESGAECVWGATVVDVEMQGNRITGVHATTPEGPVVYRAKVVIDSSGDADAARMAGAPYYIGRDVDGVLHCYSQVAHILLPNGMPRSTNWDSGYCDPHDVVDLTRARRDGVRQVWERLAPDPEGERQLLLICPLLGLRQGPVIIGDYQHDFLDGVLPKQFDDVVGFSGAKYDCHSQDYENQDDAPVLWVWLLGNRERHQGGQMPYRVMLPKGVEGMLVACRSASSTQESNYQFRTMRNQHRLGEAAGFAAAHCVRLGTTPRELDVKLVQKDLLASGGLAPETELGPVVPPRPIAQLREELASDNPKDAVWLLAHGGDEELAVLEEAVQSGVDSARFWASVALAWRRNEQALPALIEAVDTRLAERLDFTPRSRNMVPLWQSCIVLLGRIGSPQAVPVLLDVLADPIAPFDAVIASVRALGRIGDERAVEPLCQLLARDDLPCLRKFQQTLIWGRWPETEDARWQLELAIAEVLAGFGHPQQQIIDRHIGDPRNAVRRYAAIVQKLQDDMWRSSEGVTT